MRLLIGKFMIGRCRKRQLPQYVLRYCGALSETVNVWTMRCWSERILYSTRNESV